MRLTNLITICILLFLFAENSYSFDYKNPEFVEKNPIFTHIITVSPKLNKKYAYELSNKIAKYTRKYKLDAEIFVAILKQESNFKLKARGKRCGLTKDMEEVCVLSDFGLGQIYYKTAQGYDFDILLLITDLDYSIESSAIVLKDFKKRFGKDDIWWTRYNCGSRGTTKRDTCQIYKNLTKRYLKGKK